jgi:hypothetical protein
MLGQMEMELGDALPQTSMCVAVALNSGLTGARGHLMPARDGNNTPRFPEWYVGAKTIMALGDNTNTHEIPDTNYLFFLHTKISCICGWSIQACKLFGGNYTYTVGLQHWGNWEPVHVNNSTPSLK